MRVLIAEDEQVSRLSLRAFLKKEGYEVVEAENGLAALSLLSGQDPPQLAILDWMMPGLNGPEVCVRVRALGVEPYIYMLLLTGRTDRSDVVLGLDAGADDFLRKPFDRDELRVRLRTGLRVITLQRDLINAREELRQLATRDGLTRVLNRRAVMDYLTKALSRQELSVGVVLIDLDHFKAVNDNHGHQAGDEVLRETARRMMESVRPLDGVGRYGGEEFLVVLTGIGPEPLKQAAERLRQHIMTTPIVTDSAALAVTASLGVAISEGGASRDADALIHRADMALYYAKASGRNRVEAAWELEGTIGLTEGINKRKGA